MDSDGTDNGRAEPEEQNSAIERVMAQLRGNLDELQGIANAVELVIRNRPGGEGEDSYILPIFLRSIRQCQDLSQQLEEEVQALLDLVKVHGEVPPPIPEEAPAQAEARVSVSSPLVDPNLLGNGEVILAVDDERNILLLVEVILRNANYRILKAHSADEALELYEAQHQDIKVVLLDYTLGEYTGADVFHKMRQINPRANILMTSGYAETDGLNELLSEGLRGFVPKPFNRDKLLVQIKSAVRR